MEASDGEEKVGGGWEGSIKCDGEEVDVGGLLGERREEKRVDAGVVLQRLLVGECE